MHALFHRPARSRKHMKRIVLPALVLAALTAVFALVAALMAIGPPAHAGVSPAAGVVTHYNAPVCGQKYVPIDNGAGNYLNVYNAADGSTCIVTEKHHDDWYVTSAGDTALWGYPNISSGIEWGKYTCYDGHSASPSSPGSKCMRYPVRESNDGTPVTSVGHIWSHLEAGNVSYDIWFNRTWVTPSKLGQNNGAEIMIWLQHPRLPVRNVLWTTTIGGHRYYVMGARVTLNGKSWNRLDYVAVHAMTSFPATRLNLFFRNAIAHGRLSKDWYLTGVDFGEEIAGVRPGGLGISVEGYSLAGVR